MFCESGVDLSTVEALIELSKHEDEFKRQLYEELMSFKSITKGNIPS